MSDLHATPVDDEPKTPMWLPALGAALFLGAGLWWAVLPAPPPPAPEPAPVASASPSAAAAQPAAPAPPPAPVAAGTPMPMPRPGGPPGAASGAPIALPQGTNPALQEHLRQIRQQLDAKGAAGHK